MATNNSAAARRRANSAKEGHRLVEVTCRCGTQLVRESDVDDWRCAAYRCFGKKLGRTVVLDVDGKVPA